MNKKTELRYPNHDINNNDHMTNQTHSPTHPPFISAIFPAYNEEGVIEGNVDQVANYVATILKPGQYHEVLVIDDGSIDSTPEILQQMRLTRPWLKCIRHKRNAGRGKALRTGFENAKGDYVFTLDADLSYSPEHIGRMLAPLESGAADVVLASAYHPKGTVANVPFNRAIISRLGNKVLALAVGGGIHTTTCVVRGYTRESVETLILFSNGKDIHLEIIQKAQTLGLKIVEVAADLSWRSAKRSRTSKGLSFSDIWMLSRRHLFYNFLLRPTSLFIIPLSVVTVAFVITSIFLVYGFVFQALQTGDGQPLALYQALRSHMQTAQLTYFTWAFSFILLLQFIFLNLMAKQSNHHHEEMLRYISRLERKTFRSNDDSAAN